MKFKIHARPILCALALLLAAVGSQPAQAAEKPKVRAVTAFVRIERAH